MRIPDSRIATKPAEQSQDQHGGTLHAFNHAKCVHRYLGEFADRFNRCFDMAAMLPWLLRAMVATKPFPLKALLASEIFRK